jgi:ATP-dependent exoDNAse (exonuclease V) alpha subunit
MLEDRPERLNNFISRLYLAASRARKDLEFVVNTDEDGLPEVLKAAITQRFLQEDVY